MANNSNCNNCFGWMENNKVCHKIAIHNISIFLILLVLALIYLLPIIKNLLG